MTGKNTKPHAEKRKHPIGFHWKKERRKARLAERLEKAAPTIHATEGDE